MGRDEKIVQKIEEDAPFDVTPFDEKEFIRKELISFRTTAILFVFAIVVAGITFALWRYAGLTFLPLLLVALVLALSLRFIFKAAKIDISHWKRREWTGTMFMFFFFWLGFFLLAANPPFTDAAAPAIELRAHPAAQAPQGTVMLGAYVADNAAVSGQPSFCVHRYSGDAPPAYDQLTDAEKRDCADSTWTQLEGRPFWSKNETRPAGRYVAFAIAHDESGQRAVAETTFDVLSPFLSVSLPRDNRFAHPDDTLLVQVDLRIRARTVQFSLDNGTTWNHFTPHQDPVRKSANYWRSDPSYWGWKAGTFDVKLRVVPQPEFVRAEAHRLTAVAPDPGGPYKLTVDAANIPQVGTTKVNGGQNDYDEARYFNPGQTPGVGVPLLLVALAGLAVVGRRRAA